VHPPAEGGRGRNQLTVGQRMSAGVSSDIDRQLQRLSFGPDVVRGGPGPGDKEHGGHPPPARAATGRASASAGRATSSSVAG